jgi:hypothetical protein
MGNDSPAFDEGWRLMQVPIVSRQTSHSRAAIATFKSKFVSLTTCFPQLPPPHRSLSQTEPLSPGPSRIFQSIEIRATLTEITMWAFNLETLPEDVQSSSATRGRMACCLFTELASSRCSTASLSYDRFRCPNGSSRSDERT